AHGLASINNGPLAMGLLTGKYGPGSRLPADDVPSTQPWVGYFTGGRPGPAGLARPDAIPARAPGGRRPPAPGAPRGRPGPGIRTVAQAEQNAAALRLGPLSAAQMAEIARLLDGAVAQPA